MNDEHRTPDPVHPVNLLDTIVAFKRVEAAQLPEQSITPEVLGKAVALGGRRRDFMAALLHPRCGDVALIAEVKKASPSAGVICKDFDPVRIAREYEAAGASCLSILTDKEFFQGSLEDLRRVRQAVTLPLLRKDFIIDERQILETIEWGADAVLLIVTLLDDHQLRHYQALASSAGLAALVEVHNERELARALAAGARLIGVNNRDLKTFKVSLDTTERLGARLRASAGGTTKLLVTESGIHGRADVERLRGWGVCAMLVGESLMRSGNIALKAKELLGS